MMTMRCVQCFLVICASTAATILAGQLSPGPACSLEAFCIPLRCTWAPSCPTSEDPLCVRNSATLRSPRLHQYAAVGDAEDAPSASSTTRRFYSHDGFTLSYLHKPASPGCESLAPLVLVHPVGVGLSSWFWTKVVEEWDGGSEVYAPDLVGCGLENGSLPPWDPKDRGMSFPLGWVRALEALIRGEAATARRPTTESGGRARPPPRLPRSNVVVSQGGLAPVGVMLAARNPPSAPGGVGVSHLVLASPPTWKEMVTPVPEKELRNNYDFLRSPVLGRLAFNVLESRWAVRLFSNAFLFSDECDEEWVNRATNPDAMKPEARPPIMAFNAGFLNHRSYEEELRSLEQRTLVLSGSGDKRTKDRVFYGSQMPSCELQTVPGTNVLPWESPQEFCCAIQSFVGESVQ